MVNRIVIGLLALLFLSPISAYAASCASVGTGPWSDATIWNCAPGGTMVPTPGDAAAIQAGHIVFTTSSVTRDAATTIDGEFLIYPSFTVTNNGTITNNNVLHINPGSTLVNYGTINANTPVTNHGTLINCGTINGSVGGIGTVKAGPCVTGDAPPCFTDGRVNLNCGAPLAVYLDAADDDGWRLTILRIVGGAGVDFVQLEDGELGAEDELAVDGLHLYWVGEETLHLTYPRDNGKMYYLTFEVPGGAWVAEGDVE